MLAKYLIKHFLMLQTVLVNPSLLLRSESDRLAVDTPDIGSPMPFQIEVSRCRNVARD